MSGTPAEAANPVGNVPTHLWKGDIARLDHSVIRVGNLAEAIDWYQRLLGLDVVEQGAGRAYLASRLTGTVVVGLEENADAGAGLEYVSYRAHDEASLARIGQRLADAGIPHERGSYPTRPGGLEAIRLTAPTGHVVELLHARDAAKPKPTSGYQPGAFDVRTSHIQFRTTDVLETSRFMQILGFKVSTYVELPSGQHLLQFMRVNEYHHQLAILTGRAGLHHVALELDTQDFWKFCDNLAVQKIQAEYGPGRHNEGNLLFIYVRDPFGNRLEICGPMEVAGFDYPPSPATEEPWFHMNQWGPQPPESWYHEWT